MKCDKLATKEVEDNAVLDEMENGRVLTQERITKLKNTPGLSDSNEGRLSLEAFMSFVLSLACDKYGNFKNPILCEDGEQKGTRFFATFRFEDDPRWRTHICVFDAVIVDKSKKGNVVLTLVFQDLTQGNKVHEYRDISFYSPYTSSPHTAPPPQKRKARSKSPVQSKKQKTSTNVQTSLKTATTATTSSSLTVPIPAMTASELLQLMSPSKECIELNKKKIFQKMSDRFAGNKKVVKDKQSDLKVLEKYGHRDLKTEKEVEELLQDNQTMESIVNEYRASKKDFDAYSVLHDSCVGLTNFEIDALEVEFKDHLDTVRQTLKTCFPVIKDMAPDMADRLEHVLEDRVVVAV